MREFLPILCVSMGCFSPIRKPHLYFINWHARNLFVHAWVVHRRPDRAVLWKPKTQLSVKRQIVFKLNEKFFTGQNPIEMSPYNLFGIYWMSLHFWYSHYINTTKYLIHLIYSSRIENTYSFRHYSIYLCLVKPYSPG